VFSWRFNTPNDSEQFFEQALKFISGGRYNLEESPSAGERAEILGAMLRARRYLFILDGFEVLQQDGDNSYGQLSNTPMNNFLDLFATPDHNSLCLVTTRLPLMGLVHSRGVTYYEVGMLHTADSRALLRNLGIDGPDEELDRVSERWGNHALTLRLLGSYAAEEHLSVSALAQLEGIPLSFSAESRYAQLHQLLTYYDHRLSVREQALLMLFSAFRTPEALDLLLRVLCGKWEVGALNEPLVTLNNAEFEELIVNQVRRHILIRANGQYSAHPLIRDYFYKKAEEHPERLKSAHRHIMEGYLSVMPTKRKEVSDLMPLIEAVHHACRAGLCDKGFKIYRDSIETEELWLSQKLNAYDVVSTLLQDFFPQGNTRDAPLLSDPSDQRYLLNRYGVAMMNTARLDTAADFYERAIAVAKRSGDLLGQLHSTQNLSELRSYLGPVWESAEAAGRALELADQVNDETERKIERRDSLAYQGWAAHLAGNLELARSCFQQAEALQCQLDPDCPYLPDIYGVGYADFLRRTGRPDDIAYATEITRRNLERSDLADERDNVSICHRVLGDLAAAKKRDADARSHYAKALEIVRTIFERTVLTEVLSARGRWAARNRDVVLAAADLAEAEHYAVAGGYRIYEVDIRISKAWMHSIADRDAARRELGIAQDLSKKIGYHWGCQDSEELLASIST
jgi:tetratricopeptide (TPR) repeat protein